MRLHLFVKDASKFDIYVYILIASLIFFSLAVSEETCNEVESLVFDLFANLGATGRLRFELKCFQRIKLC